MNWLWLSSSMMVTWKRAELEAKLRRDSQRQTESHRHQSASAPSSSQAEQPSESKKNKWVKYKLGEQELAPLVQLVRLYLLNHCVLVVIPGSIVVVFSRALFAGTPETWSLNWWPKITLTVVVQILQCCCTPYTVWSRDLSNVNGVWKSYWEKA